MKTLYTGKISDATIALVETDRSRLRPRGRNQQRTTRARNTSRSGNDPRIQEQADVNESIGSIELCVELAYLGSNTWLVLAPSGYCAVKMYNGLFHSPVLYSGDVKIYKDMQTRILPNLAVLSDDVTDFEALHVPFYDDFMSGDERDAWNAKAFAPVQAVLSASKFMTIAAEIEGIEGLVHLQGTNIIRHETQDGTYLFNSENGLADQGVLPRDCIVIDKTVSLADVTRLAGITLEGMLNIDQDLLVLCSYPTVATEAATLKTIEKVSTVKTPAK